LVSEKVPIGVERNGGKGRLSNIMGDAKTKKKTRICLKINQLGKQKKKKNGLLPYERRENIGTRS